VNVPIRILLVDDQALFRESLALLLDAQPDLHVVGEATNGEVALAQVAALRPQVVLMDLRMPILDGVAATRRLRAEHPDVQVIALTTFDDDADVFAALRAGVIGYLLKDVAGATLFDAVRAAARGESFLPLAIATKVVAGITRMAEAPHAPPTLPHPLTERELEIVRLLAQGATNREIATALVVAEGTVKERKKTPQTPSFLFKGIVKLNVAMTPMEKAA
jgi:DNA-binding NarL/FixJ family response regulator